MRKKITKAEDLIVRTEFVRSESKYQSFRDSWYKDGQRISKFSLEDILRIWDNFGCRRVDDEFLKMWLLGLIDGLGEEYGPLEDYLEDWVAVYKDFCYTMSTKEKGTESET